jgi:hypothetical protein
MLAVILYAYILAAESFMISATFGALNLLFLITFVYFFLLFDNFHYNATKYKVYFFLVDAWNVANCWMAISKHWTLNI